MNKAELSELLNSDLTPLVVYHFPDKEFPSIGRLEESSATGDIVKVRFNEYTGLIIFGMHPDAIDSISYLQIYNL